MTVPRRVVAVALIACVLDGCIGLRWETDTRFEKIPQSVCDALHPEQTRFGDCLRLLGAPIWVWETTEDGRDGVALAYGWYRGRDRMLRITVPLVSHAKGNFDYRRIDGSLRGLVLFFDADGVLVRWRRGRMHDITSDIQAARRARPASVDLG